MMFAPNQQKFFLCSLVCHVVALLVLIIGFDMTTPLPVLENTNKNDVISAVVLGDTPKSRILPQKIAATQPPVSKPKVEPKPEPEPLPKPEPKPVPEVKPQPVAKPIKPDFAEMQKDVLALQVAEKKKLARQKALAEKALAEKKKREAFAQDLLADIKKHSDNQAELKQKQLKSQFEKTLQQQAEQSLRQQLMDEEIKLQGTQSRQAQGEVNKYKALIIQSISERWLVPTQANKKLYCELMIRLAPGGLVLDVQITKSSGDPSLDSSARAAVLKASPLPVPKDPTAFEAFRQFVLKVKPENILNNGIG